MRYSKAFKQKRTRKVRNTSRHKRNGIDHHNYIKINTVPPQPGDQTTMRISYLQKIAHIHPLPFYFYICKFSYRMKNQIIANTFTKYMNATNNQQTSYI